MTSTGTDTGEFVLLGKVTKPHGLRGEVKVYPYSGQPENFLHYREVFLALSRDNEKKPFRIEHCRMQGKLALLTFKGCSTRSHAEELVGNEIWIDRHDLPKLDAGEYYLHDLVGKQAVTEDGKTLGKVAGILETGAHDILAVKDKGHEYLIPINKSFIVGYDEKEVVLKLPSGLLEINMK